MYTGNVIVDPADLMKLVGSLIDPAREKRKDRLGTQGLLTHLPIHVINLTRSPERWEWAAFVRTAISFT